MNKTIMTTGFLLGFVAVALGAFGAHALSDVLDSKALESFKTAVYYQMIHAIVLLIIGSVMHFKKGELKRLYYLIVIGIVLFSGSIYAYYLLPLLGIELKFVVFITPLGGLMFIAAWLFGAYYSFKKH